MAIKLKHKIIILVVTAAMLPVVVMTVMTSIQKHKLQHAIENELDKLGTENIRTIAADFYKTCEISHRIMLENISSDIKVILDAVAKQGGLHLDPVRTYRWNAVNQDSKQPVAVTLPVMMLGATPFANEPSPQIAVLIDRLKNLTGDEITIFQRMNERGDLLRLASNVNLKGQQLAGTYIPAVNPDGTPNRVVETVLRGQTYQGSMFAFDRWFIAIYTPVKDRNGEVIGCLYAGIQINAIKTIQDIVRKTKIGQSGYIAITGCLGENKYRYIASFNGARDGEYLGDIKDADGAPIIREVVDSAIKCPGKIQLRDYNWQNQNDQVPRLKKAAYVYFAPWDWVIMPTMYIDDYSVMYGEVSDRINQLLRSIVLGGVIFLALAVLIAWYLGTRISRPITHIAELAGKIADGDLAAAVAEIKHFTAVSEQGEINEHKLSHDETGNLIRAIVKMTRNLNSLVSEVQKATIHLVSTATEIAASSREQEVTVNELGASTNEIVSSTKEISSTSQQLVNTMGEVADSSSNAATLADAGRTGLGKMEQSMEQLAVATSAISAKLALINDKTSNINNVVTTITKVADQTNLLSLNASIEAEKAGEYGKGFAVVAREIRRLADQTAVATLDIIKMVKEMQSAVSSGVMGMERFSEDVKQSVQETKTISEQIEGIIHEVQVLPGKFDQVIDGMKQQSIGAQQISDSMVQLSECANSTAESIRSFNEAATQLNNATLKLQKEVAIFKVK